MTDDLRRPLDAGLEALRAAIAGLAGLAPTPALAGAQMAALPAARQTRTSPSMATAAPSGSARRGGTRLGGGTSAPERDVPPASPPAVLLRAQAGDAEAFAELYDHYVDIVYRYVYYRVGTVALAEDLTSETFVRALRRLPSYQWQGRDFGAWLVTIARNLIADHYKSSRYRLEVTTDDMVRVANARETAEGPEGAVIESITNDALLHAVKRLGAEQQECIVLRFLQGLSVAETALAMGKNEGAIKALQFRAVRALGRMIPPELAE